MVLNVEQVIGYFDLNSSFDIHLINDDRKEDVDNLNLVDVFYGNEIQLFDDLHIASIIYNDKIYIYNISTVLFTWENSHDKFRSPTISSVININLPFIPTCNCSLFFDEHASTLTISTFSNDGLLHFIDISVSGKHNYSLSVLSTRIFKTELSNLTLATQITDSLYLINCKSGAFLIISRKQALNHDFLPLFSVEDLSVNDLHISTFLVVKRNVDKNTENIYVITFSEKNRDLTLLLIKFNHLKNTANTIIIDRNSDIKIRNLVGCPVLNLVEGTNLFLLLINDNMYLYKVLNLDDCSSKNNINVQFLKCFDLGFEQKKYKKDESVFSPQIYCNGSDIYIARAIFSDNICSYVYFPMYEIRKIGLNKYASNITTFNEGNFNDPVIIWSQGAQIAYYNELSYDELKCHINSNKENFLDLENIINSLLSRIFEECPSRIVFDMAFIRYLGFLKNIILLNFGSEVQHKLLNVLNSTTKFRELANLIKVICLHFGEDKFSLSMYNKCSERKFDQEKLFCLIAPFIMFINYFKIIGNYCIRIFSNKGDTFSLSPISVSTISSISQEELNGISSISSYGSNSFLYIPFYLVRDYLKFKYLILRAIFKASNINTRRHILELLNLYSTNQGENKAIILSIMIELAELLSKKVSVLNQINYINQSKPDILSNINLMQYDILTRNFTLDEFKTFIQNINESFIYFASRSDDFVFNFIEKTFKANIVYDIKYSLLNPDSKTDYKNIGTPNFELVQLIKIKNIILTLDICSSTAGNIFKYLIWKQFTQNANSRHNCSFENASQFFSDNDSFLNIGKYMATCKSNLTSYNGGIIDNNITINCGTSKVYSISPADQVYRVYKYYNAIYKFFTSDIFLNCTAKKLSLYMRSNHLFWELFLEDFCYNYYKHEDNIQLAELVYDYLENQIINGCFDHNLVRYIFYLIKLIPYRRNTSKWSHLILNKLLNDINLMDEIIELIKPEVSDDLGIILDEFSSSDIRAIYFISLLFQLFDNSKMKMCYNSIYINLLETSISLIYSSISSCTQNQKILLNKINIQYLIQYIYLCDNISDKKTIQLINKSLSCNSSKYEKILFLMTFWVKHNLSTKADHEGELDFSTISSTLFEFELDDFYSLLIKVFWKKSHEFRSVNLGDSSELPSKNITQSIYKFFLNKWRKEGKYQEIFTLAYLNVLARYYDLISYSDKPSILFPENWFEFISRDDDQEIDSISVLSEVLENLSGLFHYMNSDNQSTDILESLNTIISSLNTYIIYSEIAISKKYTDKRYSNNPICIPNVFFGIKLPKINTREKHLEAHQNITYLPSAAYISYLRWYFIGIKKLILSSSTGIEVFEYFNNYCKYLEKHNSYLEYNGIYFKLAPNSQMLGSESLANILSISMIELNFYLVINGYFETAYRLTDVASQFLDNNLKVNYENLSIKEEYMGIFDSLTKISLDNIYMTLGFWVFTYSLFLSDSAKYLNLLIEYKNDFLLQASRQKKKKLSLNSSGSKAVAFEDMILKNTKFSKTHKFDGTDYLTFSVNVNFWNSILDRLSYSHNFLQGVHIALLINEDVYNTLSMDNSVENPYLSILPNKLVRIYKDQKHLIETIKNYPISNVQHLNIFMNVIENLVNFNFIEEAVKFIAILIDHVELPIHFIAKARHMIRSSSKIYNNTVSEKLESIILRCI